MCPDGGSFAGTEARLNRGVRGIQNGPVTKESDAADSNRAEVAIRITPLEFLRIPVSVGVL